MDKRITIYQRPDSRGQEKGAEGFTAPFIISSGDTEALSRAVEFDNCPAKYENGYRHGKNFQVADCIFADIDNSHSDNPEDWITPENVRVALPNVEFYYYPSRNHMKRKGGNAPRPKFHFIFPTSTIRSAEEYTGLMKCLMKLFPALYFDPNVKSAAQLNFGVENPQVAYVGGEMIVSDYLKMVQPKLKSAPERTVVPEGTRHKTMLSFAASVLKRWGDTDSKAKQSFIKKSKKCSPLLDDKELSGIWNSALSFYRDTIKTTSGYLTPEQYNSALLKRKFALNVVDHSAISALCLNPPNKRSFIIDDARLLLRAFKVTIKLNDMNRRVEVTGLPKEYCGEDEYNLLITLITDAANALGFRKVSSSTVHDSLYVIANENRYHPVIKLLNANPWDGVDRLPELYRIMGLSEDFHKTLVRKWTLQTIAVLYNTNDTPVATQGVLVLQGAQGIGKTQFFRHLAIKEQFFKGGATLDMTNKDSLMSATKVWLCELGEIDNITKREQSSLKAFLTEQTDRFREPYARSETIRLRRTSFCGTVNPKGYLRDETGNRRYWTIPVEKMDIEKIFWYLPEWYTQLWRQIHAEYMSNPKSYLLTCEEQNKMNECNSEFEVEQFGEDEFMTMCNTEADLSEWQWMTAAQIAEKLNENYQGLHIRSEQIGRTLIRIEKRIGRTFVHKTVKGKRLIHCPPLSNKRNFGDSLSPEQNEPYDVFRSVTENTSKEDVEF